MQDGGLEIGDVVRMFYGTVANLIGGAMHGAAFDAATCYSRP
jgi:hypothetical protein